MARPKFHVQHFVACLNAAWDGTPGPRTSRTLERVGYDYAIPPDTEFPFEELEFWVYARFYRVGTASGTRDFSLDVFWHDAPGGVTRIGGRSLGAVRFSDRFSVVGVARPTTRIPRRGDVRVPTPRRATPPVGKRTPAAPE